MADIKIAGRIKAGAADNIAGYASEILFDDQASNKTVKEKIEEVASSPQTMIVTITPDGNDGYEADKTFAEIAAFIDNGGTVIAKDEEDGDSYYYLDNYIASEVVFTRNIWGSGGFSTRYYTIDNTNTVSFIDSVHHISSDVNSSSTANLANSAAVKALRDSMSEIKSISVNNVEQQYDQEGNVDITVPTSLADLADDSTHRTVTDAEKTTWNGKQDALTFDNVPTANSNNPVKSGGIKTALDAKQTTISTVNVAVDNNTGIPSGSASVSGSTLSLSFQNLKGATGATGATGPQGPQGERGLPGESGVTGDVSGFTVIQTIDPSATYGATDIAGAATVQATNQELTELAGELIVYSDAVIEPLDGFLGSDANGWIVISGQTNTHCKFEKGDYTHIFIEANSTQDAVYGFLTSYTTPVHQAKPAYSSQVSGRQSVPAGTSQTIAIPSDCNYIVIGLQNTSTYNRTPSKVRLGGNAIPVISRELDEIEEKITTTGIDGSKTYKTSIKECYWLTANSSDGTFGETNYVASGGYAVSDYIDVHKASKISFIAVKGGGATGLRTHGGYVFYDSDKEPISGQVTATTTTYTSEVVEATVPSEAYYLRFTTAFGANKSNEYTIWKQYPVSTGLNIVDNLDDGGSDFALSAEQGKLLDKRAAVDVAEIDTPILKTSTYIDARIKSETFGEEGTTASTSNCGVTDFIECGIYKRISFYGLRESTSAGTNSGYKGGFVFYDVDKNAIQDGACITHTKATASSWSALKYELDVPSNAAYFRYTVYPSQVEVKGILREPNKNIVYKNDVVNNLIDGGVDVPLSAEQGKVLLGLSSYTDERDTSVFTGDTQDDSCATCVKSGDDWVISKIGSTGYRGVGLFIGTIPSTIDYTWVIEYSSTSTKDTRVRFSTLINTQQATTIYIENASFKKNTSHAVVEFIQVRGIYNYLTVTTTDMSDDSAITIHSIQVYKRYSVQELGENVGQGSGSSSSSYANAVSLFSERKALADSMLHGDTNFSCLLFSDLHGDTTNLGRIMDLYDDWEGYFTCGINVGDTIYETINTGTSWYWDMVGDREFLFALGNHDVWGTDGGYNNAVEQAEYNAWIVPLVNKTTGLVRPSNADSSLLPYYYKDYGNIRVIVLSTYTNRLSSDLAWFADVLSDAITNSKKVIVVNHIAHSLVSRNGTTIQHNVAEEDDYNNGFKSYLVGISQQGYVDAPSSDTDNVGNGFVVAVKTFMDNGGTFITWISGHCHRDFFTDLSGTTHETTCGKQAFITLSTARADYQADNPKTWPDGTGMDSFYMFSVDETLGVFKLMKFGAETDYAMRPRKFLAYSYVEHKIVAQS